MLCSWQSGRYLRSHQGVCCCALQLTGYNSHAVVEAMVIFTPGICFARACTSRLKAALMDKQRKFLGLAPAPSIVSSVVSDSVGKLGRAAVSGLLTPPANRATAGGPIPLSPPMVNLWPWLHQDAWLFLPPHASVLHSTVFYYCNLFMYL
jgi:hypothetical protein